MHVSGLRGGHPTPVGRHHLERGLGNLTDEVLDHGQALLGEASCLGDGGVGGLGEDDILNLGGGGLEGIVGSALGGKEGARV